MRQLGSGPPLVLIHGWYADSFSNWEGAFAALGDWHVIAVDLPGHGASPAPRPFSIGRCALAVADVCDALGIGDAVVAGYSMGGPVAQLVARDRPDLVGGLVMIATAARLLPSRVHGPLPVVGESVRLAFEAGRALTHALVTRSIRGHVLRLLGHSDRASIARAARELARWDSRDWVGSLDVNAASIVTTHDHAVPPAAQEELADLLRVRADHRFEVAHGHLFCLEPEFGDVVRRAVECLGQSTTTQS